MHGLSVSRTPGIGNRQPEHAAIRGATARCIRTRMRWGLAVLCALSMCACGDPYVDQLTEGTPAQRAQRAAFLGAQGVSEAVPALIAALQDSPEEVRAKVVWALGGR